MILPNFNITPGSVVSDLFLKKNVSTFYDAIETIHNLPYGRVQNPMKIGNVITQGKGTCSTKHATLKALAEEHALYGLKLQLAIYGMEEENTKGIGPILDKYKLPYMLEAHCFLCYDEHVYDYTFSGNKTLKWRDSVLIRNTIDTDQIGGYKSDYHKSVLQDWIERDQLPYTLEELWSIREECIAALATP